jgi:hypothetical protein
MACVVAFLVGVSIFAMIPVPKSVVAAARGPHDHQVLGLRRGTTQ